MENEKCINPIEVTGLTMAYGSRVIMNELNFAVKRGSVFIVMGPSGCGKSTLLRHLIGLQEPAAGDVKLLGQPLWGVDGTQRDLLMQQVGILYQRCGLWSSMTLAENIALPLREYTQLSEKEIRQLCEFKLSLVGLGGFGNFYPSEISGGMQKRAGLARALALEPQVLFFDEPSAGLDPISAHNLDDLILELQESLGTTVVVVTHDLDSIFAIGSDAIYLDPQSKGILARGTPQQMLQSGNDTLVEFLTRGTGKTNRYE